MKYQIIMLLLVATMGIGQPYTLGTRPIFKDVTVTDSLRFLVTTNPYGSVVGLKYNSSLGLLVIPASRIDSLVLVKLLDSNAVKSLGLSRNNLRDKDTTARKWGLVQMKYNGKIDSAIVPVVSYAVRSDSARASFVSDSSMKNIAESGESGAGSHTDSVVYFSSVKNKVKPAPMVVASESVMSLNRLDAKGVKFADAESLFARVGEVYATGNDIYWRRDSVVTLSLTKGGDVITDTLYLPPRNVGGTGSLPNVMYGGMGGQTGGFRYHTYKFDLDSVLRAVNEIAVGGAFTIKGSGILRTNNMRIFPNKTNKYMKPNYRSEARNAQGSFVIAIVDSNGVSKKKLLNKKLVIAEPDKAQFTGSTHDTLFWRQYRLIYKQWDTTWVRSRAAEPVTDSSKCRNRPWSFSARFVLTDVTNSNYKFRVQTAGIDTMQYLDIANDFIGPVDTFNYSRVDLTTNMVTISKKYLYANSGKHYYLTIGFGLENTPKATVFDSLISLSVYKDTASVGVIPIIVDTGGVEEVEYAQKARSVYDEDEVVYTVTDSLVPYSIATTDSFGRLNKYIDTTNGTLATNHQIDSVGQLTVKQMYWALVDYNHGESVVDVLYLLENTLPSDPITWSIIAHGQIKIEYSGMSESNTHILVTPSNNNANSNYTRKNYEVDVFDDGAYIYIFSDDNTVSDYGQFYVQIRRW